MPFIPNLVVRPAFNYCKDEGDNYASTNVKHNLFVLNNYGALFTRKNKMLEMVYWNIEQKKVIKATHGHLIRFFVSGFRISNNQS